MTETKVPTHIVDWTYDLEGDPVQTASDELAILSARTASSKNAFAKGSKSDRAIIILAHQLERDLLDWHTRNLNDDDTCIFIQNTGFDEPHAWRDSMRVYGIDSLHRLRNRWCCLRIMISRLIEAIWQRSKPLLQHIWPIPPEKAYFQLNRIQMAKEICMRSTYALGNNALLPQAGAVSSGYFSVIPLTVAATCLLEQLFESSLDSGEHYLPLMHEPQLENLPANVAAQLNWIIGRLEHICQVVGIGWGRSGSHLLRGHKKVRFVLGRS